MSMVKEFIDIVFPVRALPKDDKERAKLIFEYNKLILLSSMNAKKLLLMIAVWGMGAMFITQGFTIMNNLVFFCLLFPAVIYLICLILYFIYTFNKKKDSIKKNYLIFVLCADILGISGFQVLMFFLDPDYSYKKFFILLCISLLGYYIGYWYYLLRFRLNILNNSQNPYPKAVTATLIIISCFILKFLSFDVKLFVICLCGFFLAIFPAQKFVNYRQYDNIQRAKNGEPFK